jgi:ubiquinone/menaquinone biosynthesis C-methylase UbiE
MVLPSDDAPSILTMGTNAENAREVYDGWADKYEATTRGWGYDMPERVAALMKKYVQANRTEAAPTFLDTGAGDGLSGVALKKEGFSTIHGNDLSEEMLKIAATRNCYTELKEVNLMKVPLPYDDNKFDAVTCVGALTCVDPEAGTLNEFVRICKRGGYICYTSRSDKLDGWKQHEDRLVSDRKWERVEEVGPLPYLPGNPEYADRVLVKIFLFRVL